MTELQQQFIANHSALYHDVCQSRDWQYKYRLLMLAGKALPALPEHLKREELRISGCESAAWLVHQRDGELHYWAFDSDARIIKGVVVALLSQLNGHSRQVLLTVDLKILYQQLGLQQGLSPSRANGVQAVLTTIGQHLSNAQSEN
jgi:cysteine desulfuration protein SufE